MKKIPIEKYVEARDKYNSMIRTVGEDQTW